MERFFTQILSYLLNVLHTTFNQVFILFVPLLILMVLLNIVAILTAKMSVRFFGRNLFLYGFAWLGCSVHELSHAFFALIFGHEIKEIALFKPNSSGESLGHVSHSYNKKSIYQKIGNFFIGVGPLLAGGIVLFGITLLLFRVDITERASFTITSNDFTRVILLKQLAIGIWNNLLSFFNLIVPGGSRLWWKLALLIYILYSVGSSMTLSKPDVGSAFYGFIWLLIFLLIFNLITLWMGGFATNYLEKGVKYISGFYFLLILTLVSNFLFLMMLFVLNLLKHLFVSSR